MSKTICFYNRWHNGDVFAGKGWMQSIMAQAPEWSFVYAHLNNPAIMQDLCEYMPVADIPESITDGYRVVEFNGIVFVNTWIGAYGDCLRAGEVHANWLSLHRMFQFIVNEVNRITGSSIQLTSNAVDYVADTDWEGYRVDMAKPMLTKHPERKHLICNGLVRSTQSNIGTMQSVVEQLAAKHPNDLFICTTVFNTEVANIKFTDYIFDIPNDLNEIAYLGSHCKTIVGKNSGPFMFTHIKENIMNSDMTFVSLSHRVSDSYACDVSGMGCQYFHCSSDDDQKVFDAIDHALTAKQCNGSITVLD